MVSDHRLTRHAIASGDRWAYDGRYLPPGVDLSMLLSRPASEMAAFLDALGVTENASDPKVAPIDAAHEVWAAGVTYTRSLDARKVESAGSDLYDRVYAAERPEIFWKSIGWRVAGSSKPIRIRRDSKWNVPEPELVLVINRGGEIVGYTAGNDVSSRDIEGENALYLPQAKVYDGSCAIGNSIVLARADELTELDISLRVTGRTVDDESGKRHHDVGGFGARTNTREMKRSLPELVACLFAETTFPCGVFLMTGTGIVPPPKFTLVADSIVHVTVGSVDLSNPVEISPAPALR